MAAPAFVQAGTGVVATTGSASPTVSATAGNLIALHCLIDGVDTLGTLSGTANIEDLAGVDQSLTDSAGISVSVADEAFTLSLVGGGSQARQAIAFGRAISTGTVTVQVQASGGVDIYVRLYEFSDVNIGTTLAGILENGTAGTLVNAVASTAEITDTGVTTLGTDRLACNFIAVNDDNTIGSFTGETGGDWAQVAYYATATGTDGAIALQTATIASAGTINGGSVTMPAADPWGVVGFALIGTTLDAAVPRYGFVNYQDPGIF